jgi:hypothetical protein
MAVMGDMKVLWLHVGDCAIFGINSLIFAA